MMRIRSFICICSLLAASVGDRNSHTAFASAPFPQRSPHRSSTPAGIHRNTLFTATEENAPQPFTDVNALQKLPVDTLVEGAGATRERLESHGQRHGSKHTRRMIAHLHEVVKSGRGPKPPPHPPDPPQNHGDEGLPKGLPRAPSPSR